MELKGTLDVNKSTRANDTTVKRAKQDIGNMSLRRLVARLPSEIREAPEDGDL